MDKIIFKKCSYELPLGYEISLSENQKINKMTMANGEVRIDLGHKRFKAKIYYNLATQQILDQILKIYEESLNNESLLLELCQEDSTTKTYDFCIIKSPVFNFKIRQKSLYLYDNLTLELE
ncbi:MAG: hypothetical protein ACRCVN_05085 [Spirochaetia bacterium]